MSYINNVIHMERLSSGKLNVVWGGCGTGKTTWALNELPKLLGIESRDIIFITSRAITAAQLRAKFDGLAEVEPLKDGEDCSIDDAQDYAAAELAKDHIHVFTMATFGRMLGWLRVEGYELLRYPKLLIVDEIHALFTDATFMSNAGAVISHIMNMILTTDRIVVGLTATPFFLADTDFPFVLLNDATFQYHALHTIVTDFKCVSRLVVERFTEGRTIIMCPDIKHCIELLRVIPQSFMLVSKDAADYTSQMDWVREYIIGNNDLPDMYPDTCGDFHPLKVLIGTSTLREGFNLNAGSNVRHVVSCCNDATSIIQFAGRVRGDIDNLAVAYTFSPNNNSRFMPKSERISVAQFRDFFFGNKNNGWLISIENLRANADEAVEYYDVEPLNSLREDVDWVMNENSEGIARRLTENKQNVKARKSQRQAKSKRANQMCFKVELEENWLNKKIFASSDDATALFKLARDTSILQGVKRNDYTLTKVIKEIKRLGYLVVAKDTKRNGRWVQYYTITKPDDELTDS